MSWTLDASLWQIWLAISIGLVLAYELGFRSYRLALWFSSAEPEKGDGFDYIISAVLALLGLLIGFTFSLAAERYSDRRDLVISEANAIGTTYLRVQILGEPARSELSRLMVSYAHSREEFYSAGRRDELLQRAARDKDDAEQRLWSDLVTALNAQPAATVNPGLLQTTNEMFDLASRAEAIFSGSLPATILNVLVLYSLVSASLIGYATAKGHHRYFVVGTILFLLIALAVSLTIDLDRPRSGSILVSTEPLARQSAFIRGLEAQKGRP